MKKMFTYFIGIGSNISPTRNIPAAIDILLGTSKDLAISRIIRTAPVGLLDDRNYFLNLAIMIRSSLAAQALKEVLNGIEIRLGRDRSDPDRKVKGSPIDLDILFHLEGWQRTILPSLLPDEPYLRVPLTGLIHFLGYQCPAKNQTVPLGVGLNFQGIVLGESEMSLMMDAEGVVSSNLEMWQASNFETQLQ